MSWKTVLVHIDDGRRSDVRVEFAFDLARRFDAHVIGLYVVCQDLLHPLFNPGESVHLATNEKQHAAWRERAQQAFEAAARRAGSSAEWRAPAGAAIDTAILLARHADVLVLGQEDHDDPAAFVAKHFVEDVVTASGRPAVIVPRSGQIRTFGENVLVAWDDSREAARALADALPLLERARFVEVVSVERHHDDQAPAGIDVAAYLERHKVRASFSSMPRGSGLGTGATMLAKANDVHADLLVMGAYAHSRGFERVLGGVTRTMLESATLPVLMSH
ncbi:universal stress protein family protein [Caballeronia arationis]|uniref:universal stress protein n=1 Tax=Caballeronia arationis TaxID=1777142 RepID=UPI00074C68E5|nr:universal stress protein [Caballeronia arationis]SAK95509.1 universal stress protein family protein [Caballeronia arationis]